MSDRYTNMCLCDKYCCGVLFRGVASRSPMYMLDSYISYHITTDEQITDANSYFHRINVVIIVVVLVTNAHDQPLSYQHYQQYHYFHHHQCHYRHSSTVAATKHILTMSSTASLIALMIMTVIRGMRIVGVPCEMEIAGMHCDVK